MIYPFVDYNTKPQILHISPGVACDLNSDTFSILQTYGNKAQHPTSFDSIPATKEASRTIHALKELKARWVTLKFDVLDWKLLKMVTEMKDLETLLLGCNKVSNKASKTSMDDIVKLFNGMKNLKHLELNFEITELSDDFKNDGTFENQMKFIQKIGFACQSLNFIQTTTDKDIVNWAIHQEVAFGSRWPKPEFKSGPQRNMRKFDQKSVRFKFPHGLRNHVPYKFHGMYPPFQGLNNGVNNGWNNAFNNGWNNSFWNDGFNNGWNTFNNGWNNWNNWFNNNAPPFAVGPQPPPNPLFNPGFGHVVNEGGLISPPDTPPGTVVHVEHFDEFPPFTFEDYNPDDYPSWHKKSTTPRPPQKGKNVSFFDFHDFYDFYVISISITMVIIFLSISFPKAKFYFSIT